MVSVPAAEPTVSVQVAALFDVMEQLERLAPLPPVTENSVLDVKLPPAPMSASQMQVGQVSVSVGVVLISPLVGEIENTGVDTVTVAVAESVESEIVAVPVPLPVAIVTVAAVALDTFWLRMDAPVTPAMENVVVPFTHDVPEPVRVKTMPVAWLEGTAVGETVKLPPPAAAAMV
jgi:hypothetical protein